MAADVGLSVSERKRVIWGVDAWVGMYRDLSPGVRRQVARVALLDVLPDVSWSEVEAARAELRGFREGMRRGINA